jgi:hypothetical protein
MTVTQEQIPALIGATAYDPLGTRIGTIGHVYLDDRENRPWFASVHTGRTVNFVPLTGASLRGDDRVVLPVGRKQVRDAPPIIPDGPDGALTAEQADALFRHYWHDHCRADAPYRRTSGGLNERDPLESSAWGARRRPAHHTRS